MSSIEKRVEHRDSQKPPPSTGVVKPSASLEGSYSSLASETSSDYAFPPEDGCSIRTESSDIGQLTKSVSEECTISRKV